MSHTEQEAEGVDFVLAQDRTSALPNYYRWMTSYFLNELSGTLIDLGSGVGHTIGDYLKKCQKVVCVDQDPALLALVKQKYPTDKVITLACDLSKDWSELKSFQPNVLTSLDVIEHIENDREFFDKCYALLPSGGKLIIKVPAQSQLYSDIDRRSGHYRRYDLENLRDVAVSAGFKLKKIKYINLAGALAFRLKRQTKKSSFSATFSPLTLKLANIAIPAIALMDRLPFGRGLSLIAVFEKP
jgi:SAM-dependent methyltransferase